MNKTSQATKAVFFLMLFPFLIVGYNLCEIYMPSFGWHKIAPFCAFFSLLGAVWFSLLCDLRMETLYLVAISFIKDREIEKANLEVLKIQIPKVPLFLLTTNKGKVPVAYTKENYKVLQELLKATSEQHITLETLEQLVKDYIIPLK